jgi:hypothetical protein
MARDMMGRRLRAWLDFFAMPVIVEVVLRRRRAHAEEIERGARAFNVDPTSLADLGLLLGILADVCFPTSRAGRMFAMSIERVKSP